MFCLSLRNNIMWCPLVVRQNHALQNKFVSDEAITAFVWATKLNLITF